jgi:hypothetical protein
MIKDKASGFGSRISDDISQFDNTGMISESLEYFDLPFHFAFLTDLSALITTLVSSATAMPVYTSEYFPFPILVTI